MAQNLKTPKWKIGYLIRHENYQIGKIPLLVGFFLTGHEFPDTCAPQGPQGKNNHFPFIFLNN